jgi:hypothetical protein
MEQASRARFPAWPESTDKQRGPLFAGRARYRKLAILLDDEVLPQVAVGVWGKESLLAGLLSLELIDCFRYSDDGPPSHAARETDQYMGTYVPGWAVLGEDDGTGSRGVRTARSGLINDTAIVGNLTSYAAADTTTAAYPDLPRGDAANQRQRDATALLVADAIGADLFITTRPYLYEKHWGVASGVTLVDVDDALATVGLYLRAQGKYVTWRGADGRGTSTMNQGLFYWVGTRELLPAAWRWFAACLQHSHAGGDERLVFVAQSVLQRTQRAIQVRGAMHVALNKPSDNDTAEEGLAAMDVMLLLLMGAVDASASVAHTTLALASDPHLVGWQRKKWLKEVSRHSQDLANLFTPAGEHVHALTILRLLRNAIHGEALQPLAVGVGRPRERTLVTLPHADTARIAAAIDALGDNTQWGVESIIPGRLHFDPGLLVEQLIPRVLALLNGVMKATPVEQLGHVSLDVTDSLPPHDRFDTLGEMNRQSIRWELGL